MKFVLQLLTIEDEMRGPTPAVVNEGEVLDLVALADVRGDQETIEALRAGEGKGIQGLLGDWDENVTRIKRLLEESTQASEKAASLGSLEDATHRIMAPIVTPPKILCAAANYNEHIRRDGGRWERSEVTEDFPGVDRNTVKPYMFIKLPQCVVGPYDQIVRPMGTTMLDYELELGAVIGKPGKLIGAEEADDHIAGFLVFNDVSSRDLNQRPDWPFIHSDWFAGKNFETSAPMGPFLVPRSDIEDYRTLLMRLRLNGTLMQEAPAGDMTFDLAEQIEFISSYVSLSSGDVIACGTPAGVGMGTGRFLQPGDVVETEIELLGCQRTVVEAFSSATPSGQ